jgi:integrase
VPVKDVAYMLGHSDAATTIRVYAHAIPSTHGAHAALMEAVLTGGSSTRRKAEPSPGG